MRLIDANKLFPNGIFYVNSNDPMTSFDELINRIHSAPTVDAVEVIRCEQCVHWDCYTHINPGFGFCKEHITIKRKNGFCDDGERKTL